MVVSSANLQLTEELQLLRRSVREFAERELRPRAAHWDEQEEIAVESFQKVAGLGLTGLGIPEQYGGSGGGYQELVVAVEEISRACASTSVMYLVTVSLAAQALLRFGNEAQKRKYLEPLAKGTSLSAFAYTEPEAGSDAAHIQTTAARHNDHYLLNGHKIFITNGDIADFLVIFATVDPSRGHKGITGFVLEKGAPGLAAYRQTGKLGMRGSSTAEIVLENVPVPVVNRLGPEGQGFKQAMQIIESSRMVIGAQAVGIAQAALDEALRYSQQRHQFGKPISEFEGLQWILADMATHIDAARLLIARAASLKDQNLPVNRESSMAKVFASETAMWVTTKAVQIFGGYGCFHDAAVQRYFRDAKITEIYEGTSEIQRVVIARDLLKRGS